MKTLFSTLCFVIIFTLTTEQNLFAQNWSLTGNNLTGNEKLGTLNNSDLRIFTNNQRRITVKGNGKVGIGILNPVYKLDVNGSLNLAFDSSIRSGGAKILTAYYTGENLFIGYRAGDTNQYINSYQGAHNTFVGQSAGRSNTFGAANAYFGNEAGYYSRGSSNTFLGVGAGLYCYTGNNNVAVGFNAGWRNAGGSYNCFIGSSAGFWDAGSEGVYIGHMAGPAEFTNPNNSTAIGSMASVTSSNTMILGSSAVNFWGFGITTSVAGQAFKVGSSPSNGNGAYLTKGGVWTDISDRKKKDNIIQLNKEDVLDKITKLEITKWRYKGSSNEYHIGPMADDFYKLFEVGNDSAVSAMDKTGVLFMGMKALIEKNAGMNSALKDQQIQIEKLRQQIEDLKHVVKTSDNITLSTIIDNSLLNNSIELTTVVLDQNSPNPFSSTAKIRYNVPLAQNTKDIQLLITDNTGTTIKKLALNPGAGIINIDANALNNGAYNYSLMVDGIIIGSKKMIVVH